MYKHKHVNKTETKTKVNKLRRLTISNTDTTHTGDELGCSGTIGSSFTTCDIRRVNNGNGRSQAM